MYSLPVLQKEARVKRVLKLIGIVLAVLLGVILIALVGLYTKARLEFSRKYDVRVQGAAIPTDAAAIERGHHLATILCMECHQDDLGGQEAFFNLGPIGTLDTPNITTGHGGLGAAFSDEDLLRVLRHGVKPNGTSVFIMPAQDSAKLSDADLAAIIAYLRAAPPVDRDIPEPHGHFSTLGYILYGTGQLGDLLRAGRIAGAPQPPPPPPAAVTAEYGRYLADINGCRDCHGQQLAGGKPSDPNSPLAPNLTQGGVLKLFSEADFIQTLRTGMTPSGTPLPNEFMPWKYKGQMTDDELNAIFAYLKSIPALPTSYAPAE